MSKGCNLKTIISNCDVFAVPFYLKVNGKDKSGTLFGLFLTIIIMIIGLLAFLFQLSQLYEGKNPVITLLQNKYMGTKEYVIPPGTFQSAVGMVDKDLNPILNTIAKTYYEVFYDICTETQCTRINSQPCSDSFIEDMSGEFGMDKLMFKFAYCMNHTYFESQPINLVGGVYSINYKRLNIQVEKCQNRTGNNYICASEEEQNEKLLHSVIVQGLQNYQFDVNNYEQPFKGSYQMNIQYITLNQPEEQFLVYHISKVISETNFYFFFPQQKIDINLEFESLIQTKRIQDQQILGKSVVLLHENDIIRTRTYQNILNILGTLGGFMDIVMIISKVLIIPFNWIEQRLYLMNCVNKKKTSMIDLVKSNKSRRKFKSETMHLLQKLEVSSLLNLIEETHSRWRAQDSSQKTQIVNTITLAKSVDKYNTKNLISIDRCDSIYDIPDERNYQRNQVVIKVNNNSNN